MIASILSWFKKPFNAEGSAVNWVLFVGLLVIAAFLWNTVLLKIKYEKG